MNAKKQELFYALVTRKGWHEFHFSRIKEEATSLQGLSRKIPIASKFAAAFITEAKSEAKHYGAIDVSDKVMIRHTKIAYPVEKTKGEK